MALLGDSHTAVGLRFEDGPTTERAARSVNGWGGSPLISSADAQAKPSRQFLKAHCFVVVYEMDQQTMLST
jgi:hypothetical protein